MINNLESTRVNFFLPLILLYTIFFSRILVFLGIPSILNHVHLILSFIIFFFSFHLTNKEFFKKIFPYFFSFILIIFISGILNNSNFQNILVYTLINTEFLIILILFISLDLNDHQVKFLKNNILFLGIINSTLAYYQSIILNFDVDATEGIFINMGNGAHLSGSLSSLIAFYLFTNKNFNNFTKFFLIFFLLGTNIVTDSKQVLVIIILIFGIYVALNKNLKNNIYQILIYSCLLVIFIYFITSLTLVQNLKGGDASYFIESIKLKFNVFNIITNEFKFFYNYLIGLGPGHVNSRLAFLIPDYESYSFFNFSKNFLTEYIFFIQEDNYLTNHITGSSFSSLFFFISSTYGEIGLLGLFAYLIIIYNISKYLGHDLFVFLLILNLLILGLIYQWPEEPAFTSCISLLIALKYHEKKIK